MQHCLQGIAIRKELQTCRKKFEGPSASWSPPL